MRVGNVEVKVVGDELPGAKRGALRRALDDVLAAYSL